MKRAICICIGFVTAVFLTACGSVPAQLQDSIDETALQKICGSYDLEDSWWHLEILSPDEWEEDKPYLTIYDQGAGNPGVEGTILVLDQQIIIISIDEEYFEQLPGDKWEMGDDLTLEVGYTCIENGICLTNNGESLFFSSSEECW